MAAGALMPMCKISHCWREETLVWAAN